MIYDLCAVVLHTGRTAYGGHYTSQLKDPPLANAKEESVTEVVDTNYLDEGGVEGRWYCANDETVGIGFFS